MAQLKCRAIGTSSGFVVPHKILFALGIAQNDIVDAEIFDKTLIIKKSTALRAGWNNAFAAMAKAGDDDLLLPNAFADENLDEAI